MKNLAKNQSGIAHLPLIIALVVISAVAVVGTRVHSMQQQRREDAARAAAQEHESKLESTLKARQAASEEEKEVEVPAPATEEKPVAQKPKTEAKPKDKKPEDKKKKDKPAKLNIAGTSASVGAENVVLSADLPGTYTGKCKALVKLHDGSNAQWFHASFGPAASCSVSVPLSSLSAGTEWKFYVNFYSNDDKFYGESSHNTFSL